MCGRSKYYFLVRGLFLHQFSVEDMFTVYQFNLCAIPVPVADPGFPEGDANCRGGGVQHTILPNFPENCMKSKELGCP